ncbi:MAG TPA: C25 family cysteine peptidase [bacterium]|jgi:hypothetical protein
MTYKSALLLLALLLCSTSLANLHDTANRADYLIISTRDVLQNNSWIHDLANWRNQNGRTVGVISTDSIAAEFDTGTSADSTLKNFLWYAYRNWQQPRLRDVFIIGFHNVVPSHVEDDSSFWADSTGEHWYHQYYISDYFYVTDPDSNNHLPLFTVGRLPWDPDSGALWNYYSKITAYETPSSEDWQRRVHIIADYSDPYFSFWQDHGQPIADEVGAGYTIERDCPDVPPQDPWYGSREDIIAHMNAGSYLLTYVGHGGFGVWSARMMLLAETFDSLANGHRLPILAGYSYDVERYSGIYRAGTIATSLLSNPDGGAIACIGVSSWMWANAGLQLRRINARLATSDSVQTLSDIWRMSLDEFVRANPNGFDANRAVQQTTFGSMLLGDPGLRLPVHPAAAKESHVSPYPLVLSLSNAPNPFNPSTQIQFELNQAAHIKLEVLNILGQHVDTLLDETETAGAHTVTWNANAHPSGLYFAVLQTGSLRQVKKMMLLK